MVRPSPDEGRLAAGLTEQVRTLLEEAAVRVLLPRYRKLARDDIFEKAADELVTIADRECEAMLAEGLARIAPEASIVGEEAAELDRDILRRLGGPLCWIIDPLDGTGNFAAGEGPFGVMVALATHGRPIGAWILDPVGGRFCFAAAGRGAFIDGRQVAAVGKERERPSVALSSLLKRRCDRFEEVVRRLRPAYRLVDIPRCAAELYPAMIEGACQATLFERTLAWDHAAGVLLLEEAGGRCARLDGADYRTDDDRVGLLVATSRKAWEEVAERLRKLPE